MTIKFQYNKTALQGLNKQLKIRQKALPTLKNKEAALRLEVKNAKAKTTMLESKLRNKLAEYSSSIALWNEFLEGILKVSQVETYPKKIAGVSVPVLKNIAYSEADFSLYNTPQWFPEGISLLKEFGSLAIEKEIFYRKMQLLDHARRKTTQKVNLYEKVQIPEYEDAIRKIKRFLEDEENLSKSAQKIVKKRRQKQRET